MDFSAKLENLQAKVNETVETARAAAAENRDQLKQRVDQAQDDANQAMEDAKQQAEETADRAKSK
jgi:ABC-type transporter Mla subunit MlaD